MGKTIKKTMIQKNSAKNNTKISEKLDIKTKQCAKLKLLKPNYDAILLETNCSHLKTEKKENIGTLLQIFFVNRFNKKLQ